MKIVGFLTEKIFAEKKESTHSKIEVKSGLNIVDITEQKIEGQKQNILKFDFLFSLEYAPNLGKIEVNGSVLILDEENQSKEILKQWKKKNFTHPIKVILFNLIMNKCNLKALNLEEQLGLPFHIPFPKITASPKT